MIAEYQPPSAFNNAFYWLCQTFCWCFFKFIWRLEVTGTENVPLEGGLLIACNHLSLADPPLISVSSPRKLYFFAKEELFRIPVVGWGLNHLNAFPVRRYEHDIGAFKKAQHLLRSGQAVLLFPEGRRNKTGELGQAKAGVGMLAYKTGARVVPVCIQNSNRMGRMKKLKVRFGAPLSPPQSVLDQDRYQTFSDSVLAAVAELQSRMYNE